MKKYFNHPVKKAISVSNLVTIESLDISSTFSYPVESHDFYEFAYIDDGSLLCCFEEDNVELRQGDFLLIPPGRTHFYEADHRNSAMVFIVCFRCNSDILSLLDHKIELNKDEKVLVWELVKEAKNAFIFPFHEKLKLREAPLFGAQQLVESSIEHLLITLVRKEMRENGNVKFVMNSLELENNLVKDLVVLLKEHLYSRITLEEICCQTYYSKTFLNSVFKKNTGSSIMNYYNRLKIEEAKRLLRENVSPTVTANRLGFESATYFTKVFKRYTGKTPSGYKKTVL
ncbi:MAG: helix-turn-helix transcriptional regulator [Eubacteriales bacterium]|nr:helix-turn-helix transcriptional regulator [Candidatus Colimorpha enterica]